MRQVNSRRPHPAHGGLSPETVRMNHTVGRLRTLTGGGRSPPTA
jgi:hypothetical protein